MWKWLRSTNRRIGIMSAINVTFNPLEAYLCGFSGAGNERIVREKIRSKTSVIKR